jgi:hypothetical protein
MNIKDKLFQLIVSNMFMDRIVGNEMTVLGLRYSRNNFLKLET